MLYSRAVGAKCAIKLPLPVDHFWSFDFDEIGFNGFDSTTITTKNLRFPLPELAEYLIIRREILLKMKMPAGQRQSERKISALTRAFIVIGLS